MSALDVTERGAPDVPQRCVYDVPTAKCLLLPKFFFLFSSSQHFSFCLACFSILYTFFFVRLASLYPTLFFFSFCLLSIPYIFFRSACFLYPTFFFRQDYFLYSTLLFPLASQGSAMIADRAGLNRGKN